MWLCLVNCKIPIVSWGVRPRASHEPMTYPKHLLRQKWLQHEPFVLLVFFIVVCSLFPILRPSPVRRQVVVLLDFPFLFRHFGCETRGLGTQSHHLSFPTPQKAPRYTPTTVWWQMSNLDLQKKGRMSKDKGFQLPMTLRAQWLKRNQVSFRDCNFQSRMNISPPTKALCYWECWENVLSEGNNQISPFRKAFPFPRNALFSNTMSIEWSANDLRKLEKTEACVWWFFGDHPWCWRCLRCRLRVVWVRGLGVPSSFRRGSNCFVGRVCFPRPCCWGFAVQRGWRLFGHRCWRGSSQAIVTRGHSPCAMADGPVQTTPKVAGLLAKQPIHIGKVGAACRPIAHLPALPRFVWAGLHKQIHQSVGVRRSPAKKTLSTRKTSLPGAAVAPSRGNSLWKGLWRRNPASHTSDLKPKTQTETIWARANCTRKGCKFSPTAFAA